MRINPSNHYIKNDSFESKLNTYNQSPNDPSLLEELCGEFFYPLARRLVAERAYGKSYSDDLVQKCVIHCTSCIGKFARSNGKAFSFFSIVIINKIKDGQRSEGIHSMRQLSFDDPNVLDMIESRQP